MISLPNEMNSLPKNLRTFEGTSNCTSRLVGDLSFNTFNVSMALMIESAMSSVRVLVVLPVCAEHTMQIGPMAASKVVLATSRIWLNFPSRNLVQ